MLQNNYYEDEAKSAVDQATDHVTMGPQWLTFLLVKSLVYALLAIAQEISDLRLDIRQRGE